MPHRVYWHLTREKHWEPSVTSVPTASMRPRTTAWVRAEHCWIRDKKDVEEAEIIREKGTNRSKFFRGQIDKYTWVNYGSSYLPSDMNAAYLYAQLEIADEINEARLACWNRYYEQLLPLKKAGKIDLPTVPEGCVHKRICSTSRQEIWNREQDLSAI